MNCVFALSTGRVGTETLSALLQLSPEVDSRHEPSPRLFRLSKLSYEKFDLRANGDIFDEAFLTSRIELLREAHGAGKVYAETSPHVTFLARSIKSTLKNAGFMHVVRCPLSVVTSGMRRRWYDSHHLDFQRIVPRRGCEFSERWSAMTPFQKNVWLWTETNKWILDFLENDRPKKQMTIRAEDVFDGNEAAIGEIYRFAGAKMPKVEEIEKVLGKKLNAQKSGEFAPAAAWSNDMKKFFLDVAGETTIRFGYESELDRLRT
ncbi:MAG: hypothetical protein NUW37_20030 [Planctomycetes bacterium]|nr:hypothetical protein [Planctomycetota bacterium]